MSKEKRNRKPAFQGVVALLLGIAVAGCGGDRTAGTPRAVILMIGDGMGVSQVTFARQLLQPPEGRWSFEQLPYTAIVSTRSASNPTTDSGAAATAMSTGAKTSNLRIGTTARGEAARTVAEAVKAAGWRVGLVTTTTVTHATPAAFYAHVDNRYVDVDDIGSQLLEFGPDVVLGGGVGPMLPEEEYGERADERNLLSEAVERGYTVWSRASERTERPDRLMGLLANDHFEFRLDDRRNPEERRDPPLAELTRIALDVLSRDETPFFLMIEGGRIDHACHSFDAATSAYEVEDFSQAISVVRAFADDHPDTLMIVTADHATGGLAINDYVDWDGLRRQRASVEWMAEQLRNAGAGASLVQEMTGYEDISEEELDSVRDEPDKYQAWRNLGQILSRRNGISWLPTVSQLTKGHTGEDVPLYAGGFAASRFQGVLDNTEIAQLVVDISGLQPSSPPE